MSLSVYVEDYLIPGLRTLMWLGVLWGIYVSIHVGLSNRNLKFWSFLLFQVPNCGTYMGSPCLRTFESQIYETLTLQIQRHDKFTKSSQSDSLSELSKLDMRKVNQMHPLNSSPLSHINYLRHSLLNILLFRNVHHNMQLVVGSNLFESYYLHWHHV